MRKVSKMILVLFAVVAILIGLNNSAYASEIVTITDSGSGSNATTNAVNNIGKANTATNEPEIVIENEVPEEDIPETGREDTVLFVLIAVVAISAIYTYLKVRKYNI